MGSYLTGTVEKLDTNYNLRHKSMKDEPVIGTLEPFTKAGEESCVYCNACDTPEMAILNMNIQGLNGNVCVDAAATHAISDAVLYHILKDQGVRIQKTYSG
ncbi:hypothetical protein CDAR_384221 [Caerostris darwini]|uniref:Uncharacterized protein n=1 Tax=Caerostris darwini TaxID=1538125 RepID=A0AAV4QXL0_9ARAC|nr:hypothetical protein CDAR_384221 [Caerostris darwini]